MPIGNFHKDSRGEYIGKAWLKKNNNCRRRSILKIPLQIGSHIKKKNIFEIVKWQMCYYFLSIQLQWCTRTIITSTSANTTITTAIIKWEN